MGKTVFGIPSVKEKSQSGGAVAPKGTVGGASTGGSGGSQEGKKQNPQHGSASSPGKSPMAKPAMAKPAVAKSAPVSKPVAKAGSASKTMFGMPAMNLPVKGAASPAPSTPQESVVSPKKEASTAPPVDSPAAAPSVGKGAAYMATMMGVPAVTDEMVQAVAAPKESATSTPQTESTAAVPANDGHAIENNDISVESAPQSEADAQQSVVDSQPEVNRQQAAEQQQVGNESAPAAVAVTPSTPLVKSPEPPRGLVIGLIVGFVFLVGSIGFVAWKFLLS